MRLIRKTIYLNIASLIKVFPTLLLISNVITPSFVDIWVGIMFKCLLRLTFEEYEVNDDHNSPGNWVSRK